MWNCKPNYTPLPLINIDYNLNTQISVIIDKKSKRTETLMKILQYLTQFLLGNEL